MKDLKVWARLNEEYKSAWYLMDETDFRLYFAIWIAPGEYTFENIQYCRELATKLKILAIPSPSY